MKKRIAGIVLVVLSLGALGFWELWGRENLSYDTVLVLRESQPAHTLITAEMLKERKVEQKSESSLGPEAVAELIGLETAQFVAGGTELYYEYFSESVFAADEENGRYVLSLPEHWLQSYPQTIKRGDKIYFYCGGRIVADAVAVHVRDGTNQEVWYGDYERSSASAAVSLIEIVAGEEQVKILADLAGKGNKFVVLYH